MIALSPFAEAMISDEIDYAQLAGRLERAGSSLSPAELHGSLCGVLAAAGQNAAADWRQQSIEQLDAEPALIDLLAAELAELQLLSWNALSGLGMQFEPFLPDEEALIEERVGALAVWCHGFLAGLVVGGLDMAGARADLSTELEEVIADFGEISRAGVGAEEADEHESSERSFTELTEYVRVAAQLVFEELGQAPSEAQERQLH